MSEIPESTPNNPDLLRAIRILNEENCTCVLCKGDVLLTSHERGIKPLLQWLRQGAFPQGFSAADKVIGKAAAFLYVLAGASEVYSFVISEPAYRTLTEHGITVHFEHCVEAIYNRNRTGFCPMETAVKNVKTPEEALGKITETLKRLQESSKLKM